MRQKAYCPFISHKCDGGGNLYMSVIKLKNHQELKNKFPEMDEVHPGVCSIQLSEGASPWIICPRRLLYMGDKAKYNVLHGKTQTRLLEVCGFSKGTKIGIWEETKIKYKSKN